MKIVPLISFVPSNPNQINATPLYVASRNGHDDIVQTLLGAGAGVNIATSNVSYNVCGVKLLHDMRRKCVTC